MEDERWISENSQGVSLRHLASLQDLDRDDTVHRVCEKILSWTGNNSYIEYLLSDSGKHRFVSKAQTFISYAWNYKWGDLLDALVAELLKEDSDVFIWMDVFVINQHKIADVKFEAWTQMFRGMLKNLGKANLVLIPWEKPIPVERSWCVFEMVVMEAEKRNLRLDVLMDPKGEKDFKSRLKSGTVDLGFFNTLFAGINVERAGATKDSDRKEILSILKQTGIIKVNDLVMSNLKNWLDRIIYETIVEMHEDTEEKANVLGARAGLLQAVGKMTEAVSTYRDSLDISRSIVNNDMNVALRYNNIAMALVEQGDPELEAEGYFRQAISICRSWQGDAKDNPHLPVCLGNLAVLLESREQFDEAEKFYREALKIDIDLYGSDHPSVANDLLNLGGMFQSKGDLQTAQNYISDSLQLNDRLLGPDHPSTIMSRAWISHILRETGRFKEAMEVLNEIVESRRRVQGNEHPDTAIALNSLAKIMVGAGQVSDARKYVDESIQIFEKSLGKSHAHTVNARSYLNEHFPSLT